MSKCIKKCNSLGDCKEGVSFCINKCCVNQNKEESNSGMYKTVFMPKKSKYVYVNQLGELKDILKECCIKTYLYFICEYLHDVLDIEYKLFIPYIPIPEKIWVSKEPKISEISMGGESITITKHNVKYKELNLRKIKYKPLNEIKSLDNKTVLFKLHAMNIICNLLEVKHTDLHEGNIYYKAGRIGIIDWGRVIFKYSNSTKPSKFFYDNGFYIGERLSKLMTKDNINKHNKFWKLFETEIKRHLNGLIPNSSINNDQYMYSVGNYLLLENNILNRYSDIGLESKTTINDCICMDDCKYNNICDLITGICTKSKKCKVNKELCKDKKTGDKLSYDYCK